MGEMNAKKRVTVIGGGGTAIFMAAYLTLQGHQVTVCDEEWHGDKLKAIRDAGNGVDLIGNCGTGHAVIHSITFDAEEALKDAEVVLVSAMAKRHETLADWIVPYLKDGQVVCFSAGNCSSIMLKKKLGDKKVIVGEMQGNIGPCRLVDTATVTCAFPYAEKPVAAFPAKDNEALVKGLSPVYPCRAVKNVFQAALSSPNVSIHLAGTLLNTSKMETMKEFRLYQDGLSPSVAAVIEAVEDERDLVMDRMGYPRTRAVGQIYALLDYPKHPEVAQFRVLSGPTKGVHDRYVVEDAHAGNSLLASIAKNFGIKTPVVDSLLTLASVLNKEDFYAGGVTLENLGLAGKSAEEINRYLETGGF